MKNQLVDTDEEPASSQYLETTNYTYVVRTAVVSNIKLTNTLISIHTKLYTPLILVLVLPLLSFSPPILPIMRFDDLRLIMPTPQGGRLVTIYAYLSTTINTTDYPSKVIE